MQNQYCASLSTDLHSRIFAYDCRMRFLERAQLASWKNRIQFQRYKIACGYDCLKYVSKAHDILHVVHDNSKQVASLIQLHEITRVVDLS